MNKSECKSYIIKAMRNIQYNNKSITLKNLEIEMNRVIRNKRLEYISYSKIALHILQNSATEITPKNVAQEIDSVCRLYNKVEVIEKAKELSIQEEKAGELK